MVARKRSPKAKAPTAVGTQGEVRRQIQAAALIEQLHRHALGQVEMTAAQVSSAKILLDKALGNAPASHEAMGGELSEMLRDIFAAAKGSSGASGLLGARRKI